MVRKLSLLLGLLFSMSFAAHAQGILSDKVEAVRRLFVHAQR